jgi:hypothetical protein
MKNIDRPDWNCSTNKGFYNSRRDFLSKSALGIGGLALADLLSDNGLAQVHHDAKAKRVIHIFLQGGPTHIDTFDYKPEVNKRDGEKHGNSVILGSPFIWEKVTDQIWLPEIFPNLKRVADDICVINSMVTDAPDHNLATIQMHTGSLRFVRPSVGSWVTYGLGTENRNLPAFVSLRTGGASNPRAFQSSFLPGEFQGTPINTQLGSVSDMISNIKARNSNSTQRSQIDLLTKLNAITQKDSGIFDSRMDSRIESFELAYNMQVAATDVFDVSKEPEVVQEAYGKTPQGKQFLTARRLVEKDVRFVQVYHGSWDHHSDIKGTTARKAAEIDKPLAALVEDLSQRGLLDETLIVVSGEFGRSLKRDNVARGNYGRSHWAKGFSSVMIGGGVKGGIRYGSTDELGQMAVEDNMHIHDLHATILHLLGLDHEKLVHRFGGRDFRLTDVYGEVAKEIIA